MRAAYLDCFSGISGNMFLGALVDAGLPEQVLRDAIAKIDLKGFSIKIKPVDKWGIRATHLDVDLTAKHHHRGLADILKLIRAAELSDAVKDKACLVFERLGKAEAKVHGMPLDKVHFHEVGAVDAIIDIAGTVFGFHYLGVEQIYCSPLRVGRGFVKAAHGIMPIPAPATAELLHGIPWYPGDIDKELVTPTGAALVAELCSGFGDRPTGFLAEKTAYGAGTYPLHIRVSVPTQRNPDGRPVIGVFGLPAKIGFPVGRRRPAIRGAIAPRGFSSAAGCACRTPPRPPGNRRRSAARRRYWAPRPSRRASAPRFHTTRPASPC